MGKFSYKKRKGTRKQSFKNRKRVKKGGDKHENKDAAQEEAAPTETVDNTNQDAAAGDAQAGRAEFSWSDVSTPRPRPPPICQCC